MGLFMSFYGRFKVNMCECTISLYFHFYLRKKVFAHNFMIYCWENILKKILFDGKLLKLLKSKVIEWAKGDKTLILSLYKNLFKHSLIQELFNERKQVKQTFLKNTINWTAKSVRKWLICSLNLRITLSKETKLFTV